MKKLLSAFVLAFSLSGCVYQSVNFSDIDAAAKACGGIDQISELSSNWIGFESVICHNRNKFVLTNK
jgi:hypothetical protein